MFFCKLSIVVLLVTVVVGLQRSGWLDRVVQYHKAKFFREVNELAPIKIDAELRPKPADYVDSKRWDYDSVIRLLTLIRASESGKKVHKALRRMFGPTRRIMMSMKNSMARFPSIKSDGNVFYYDVEYTSSEEESPAPAPIPEDDVVLVVSNPVEARLPSARISVQLLREILQARARAARQMPLTTPSTIPWKSMSSTVPLPDGAPGGDGGNGTGGGDGAAGDGAGGNSTAGPESESSNDVVPTQEEGE